MDWDGAFPRMRPLTPPGWDGVFPLGPEVVAPQVVSAVAMSYTTVQLVYDMQVKHVSALNTDDSLHSSNYVVTSPTGLIPTVTSVSLDGANPTIVTLQLSGYMTNGATYTVTVSNVKELLGQFIDPAHNYALFSGLGGPNPQVVLATAPSYTTVRVTFDTEVKHSDSLDPTDSLCPVNYVLTSPTGTIQTVLSVSVGQEDPTIVTLQLSGALTGGATYTVTVSNVQSMLWQVIDPAYNSATFLAPPSTVREMVIIWVAKTGNDVTGDGSQQNPYLTIERALLDFNNGDQIRILDGVYVTTDTICVTGLAGSIFAETAEGVTIQPLQASVHGSAIYIANAARFFIQGVNIIQSASDTGHVVGIYVDNVENFIAFTCAITDFSSPSGDVTGIYARGSGRILHCRVEDLSADTGSVCGIDSEGLGVFECTVRRLRSTNGVALGIRGTET